MNCLDCKTPLIFRDPQRTRRAGVAILRLACPGCGGKFLATDAPYSHPYRTHQKRDDVKKVRTVRLSDAELAAVEDGRLRLVVISRRITLAV